MPFSAILYYQHRLTKGSAIDALGLLLDQLSRCIPDVFRVMHGEVHNQLGHMTRWTPYKHSRAMELVCGGRVKSITVADTSANKLEASSFSAEIKMHHILTDSPSPLNLSIDLYDDCAPEVIQLICDALSEFAKAVPVHYGVAHASPYPYDLSSFLNAMVMHKWDDFKLRPPDYKDPYEEELTFYGHHELELKDWIRRTYWGNWVGPTQWRIIRPLLDTSSVKCDRITPLQYSRKTVWLTERNHHLLLRNHFIRAHDKGAGRFRKRIG